MNKNAKILVIRPAILKIPLLDYVSVLFSHKKEIKKQLQEWSPDVIVGDAVLNSYWGAKAAQRANIPFIYYWFELMHLLIPIKPLIFIGKLVEKASLKRTDKVLATSESLKNAISEMGYPIEKIQVLEVGVEFARYDLNDSGDFLRDQYNLTKDDLVLLFMGWLYKFSGLKEVCIELSKLDNNNIKLIIVGEGDAYQELKNIIIQYNLKDKVILAGQKPYNEMPQYLAAANVCLLPAYNNETMRDIVPGKVYEYMAAGKPVISTELPGMINKFGTDNGIVFVKTPEDTIGKAVELFETGQFKDLGFKARKYIETYSWDNIANDFEKILLQSVADKANRHN
jgi:glycosyltransferase involved in cell wall biosynthesis